MLNWCKMYKYLLLRCILIDFMNVFNHIEEFKMNNPT